MGAAWHRVGASFAAAGLFALVASLTGAPLACGAKTGLLVPDAAPTPPHLRLHRLPDPFTGKVDLLLAIDNSTSMDDKQNELSSRIPAMLSTIVGDPTREVVTDVHVGIITSSLGSYGTSACDTTRRNPRNDDRGHLLPRPSDTSCSKVTAAAPLRWVFDPATGPSDFSGTTGLRELSDATSCVVASAGSDGCGFEAQLESVYRFLIDPAPPLTSLVSCVRTVRGDDCTDPATGKPNQIVSTGVDTTLLAERTAFLRPDSTLVVLLLTDENDNSFKPVGTNWIPQALAPGTMARGWSACANVPDDVEPDDNTTLFSSYGCKSCFIDGSDPACGTPWPLGTNVDTDALNTRESMQVQRFGYNFLWSRDRYVRAFTSPTLTDGSGKAFDNPVFAGGVRTTNEVVLAVFTGVPEHLVANADHSPKALSSADWDRIVGPKSVRDPHMIESIAPRAGVPHFAGDRAIDSVNGGDIDSIDGAVLQQACIAKRATSLPSTDRTCSDPTTAANSPLCDRQPDGTYRHTYFGAYPGLRQLRIARELGTSGFVASLCAESYAPTTQALARRLHATTSDRCVLGLPAPTASGESPCIVVEALAADVGKTVTRCEDLARGGYCTPGAGPCRVAGASFSVQTPAVAAAMLQVAVPVRHADGSTTVESVGATSDGRNVWATGSDGVAHLVCEVPQLSAPRVSAAEASACAHDPKFALSSGGGFCFSTDPAVEGPDCVASGGAAIAFRGSSSPHRGSALSALCYEP